MTAKLAAMSQQMNTGVPKANESSFRCHNTTSPPVKNQHRHRSVSELFEKGTKLARHVAYVDLIQLSCLHVNARIPDQCQGCLLLQRVYHSNYRFANGNSQRSTERMVREIPMD